MLLWPKQRCVNSKQNLHSWWRVRWAWQQSARTWGTCWSVSRWSPLLSSRSQDETNTRWRSSRWPSRWCMLYIGWTMCETVEEILPWKGKSSEINLAYLFGEKKSLLTPILSLSFPLKNQENNFSLKNQDNHSKDHI